MGNVKKHGLSEPEAATMIWAAVMSAIEWNKKEDLLMEQAMKHLKEYIPLFKVFTTNAKSELVLCNKVQEYCYDNQNFLKCFNKKSGLDSMLTELFPTNKRSSDGMKNHFVTAGLPEIVTYLSSIENAGAKKELQRSLRNSIVEGQAIKEMVADLRDNVKKHGLSKPEAATMIWAAVMSAIEWNKKEDLLM